MKLSPSQPDSRNVRPFKATQQIDGKNKSTINIRQKSTMSDFSTHRSLKETQQTNEQKRSQSTIAGSFQTVGFPSLTDKLQNVVKQHFGWGDRKKVFYNKKVSLDNIDKGNRNKDLFLQTVSHQTVETINPFSTQGFSVPMPKKQNNSSLAATVSDMIAGHQEIVDEGISKNTYVHKKDLNKIINKIKQSQDVMEVDTVKDVGKNRLALQQDFLTFTEKRVAHNQQKIVDLFNERPQFQLHYTDKEVTAITEEDIRFPLNYVAIKSPLEENLETIKKKHHLELKSKETLDHHFIHLNETMPLNQMASIIGSPNEFSKVKNCFINYKKHVRTKAEVFLMHKFNKRMELQANCELLIGDLTQKFDEDKKKYKREARKRLHEKEAIIQRIRNQRVKQFQTQQLNQETDDMLSIQYIKEKNEQHQQAFEDAKAIQDLIQQEEEGQQFWNEQSTVNDKSPRNLSPPFKKPQADYNAISNQTSKVFEKKQIKGARSSLSVHEQHFSPYAAFRFRDQSLQAMSQTSLYEHYINQQSSKSLLDLQNFLTMHRKHSLPNAAQPNQKLINGQSFTHLQRMPQRLKQASVNQEKSDDGQNSDTKNKTKKDDNLKMKLNAETSPKPQKFFNQLPPLQQTQIMNQLKNVLKPGVQFLNEGSVILEGHLRHQAKEKALKRFKNRFGVAQEGLPVKGTFSPRFPVPRLSDPDIVQLMTKYPNLVNEEKKKEQKGQKVKELIQKAEDYLEFSTSEYDINLHELKLILQKERVDKHLQAANLLSQASDIEDKNLKTHINYTLATMRDEKEMEKEVEMEFFHMLTDPVVSMLKSKIIQGATMRKAEQREWKKKLDVIFKKVREVEKAK